MWLRNTFYHVQGGSAMSFEEIFLLLPRLIGFLITFPLRLLGIDFDWGIR
jgi:hypothetical protein